jgi:hypothetical protein
MRMSIGARFLLAAVVGVAILAAQSAMPMMRTVDPMTAKAGDVLTVTGENLEQAKVAEVYLTDGEHDYKAKITEQSTDTLKLIVPTSAKPGRLALLVIPRGKNPQPIEEPVKVTIEE